MLAHRPLVRLSCHYHHANIEYFVHKRFFGTRKRRKLDQKSVITTRDRLRRERQLLLEPQTTTNALHRAQGRLNFLKDKLYKHWNPEARPAREELIMDRRWWMWNIALAISPAVGFGLLCEFWVQHKMNDFFLEQEINSLRQTKGDAYVEAHWEQLHPPPPERFLARVYRTFAELKYILLGDTEGKQDLMGNDRPKDTSDEHPVQEGTREAHASVVKEEMFDSLTPEEKITLLLKRLEDLEQKISPTSQEAMQPPSTRQQRDIRQRKQDDFTNKLEHRLEDTDSTMDNTRQNDSAHVSVMLVLQGIRDTLSETMGHILGLFEDRDRPVDPRTAAAPSDRRESTEANVPVLASHTSEEAPSLTAEETAILSPTPSHRPWWKPW